MKGIILAGGSGTRLRPLTDVISKGLLPVQGKPLVQYNIESLIRAKITDICLVVRPDQATQYAMAFGDGSAFNADINLRFQVAPKGIADALRSARRWAGYDNIMVLLGDSIFGHDFGYDVKAFETDREVRWSIDPGAVIYFACQEDPSWCAQIEWYKGPVQGFYDNAVVKDIHEKPKTLVSHHVVPGCYIYDDTVWDRIDGLKPSNRGELEITDLNRSYLKEGRLGVVPYKGLWLDAGTDMQAYINAQLVPDLP